MQNPPHPYPGRGEASALLDLGGIRAECGWDASAGGDQAFVTMTPRPSASRTSSATEPARILSMTRARCTLTVFSTTPSSDEICLFSIQFTILFTSDDDVRDRTYGVLESVREIQPVHAGHAHVQHEAARAANRHAVQEFAGRGEDLHPIPVRRDHASEALAHGGIVVHDEDH